MEITEDRRNRGLEEIEVMEDMDEMEVMEEIEDRMIRGLEDWKR